MAKKRDAIRLTDEEIETFLSNPALNCTLATMGRTGFPELTAMWFARIDGRFHFSTYAKSQKIKNLERNPKCAVLIEDGVDYAELRGYSVEGEGEVIFDPELAGDVMVAISRGRGTIGDDAPQEVLDIIRERARKRAVIRIEPVVVKSWDHRKLGGGY